MTSSSVITAQELKKIYEYKRYISLIGIGVAFGGSALSIVTARLFSSTELVAWRFITVVLWAAAFGGMIAWVQGRNRLAAIIKKGGWRLSFVAAEQLDQKWSALAFRFDEPQKAERVFGDIFRYAQKQPASFPLRMDLGWLIATEDDTETNAVILFISKASIHNDGEIVSSYLQQVVDAAGQQEYSPEIIADGDEVRENYFMRLGGCGATEWLSTPAVTAD